MTTFTSSSTVAATFTSEQVERIVGDMRYEVNILEDMISRHERETIRAFSDRLEKFGVCKAVSAWAQAAAEAEELNDIFKHFSEALQNVSSRVTESLRELGGSPTARALRDGRDYLYEMTEDIKDSLLEGDLWSSNCTGEFYNAVDRCKAKAAQKGLRRGERIVRLFDEAWLKGMTEVQRIERQDAERSAAK